MDQEKPVHEVTYTCQFPFQGIEMRLKEGSIFSYNNHMLL